MSRATEGEVVKVSEMFSREEIRELTRRSNWRGWLALLSIWSGIAASFIVLAVWPHPLTLILALIVLGGRQLGCAILMHEGSHGTLFANKRLSRFVSDWFAGKLVWTDQARYRVHHGKHHRYTGTERDVDRSLVANLPTTRRGLYRKFLRDLLGLTGLKRLVGLFLMDMGLLKWTVATDTHRLPRRRLGEHLRSLVRNAWGVWLMNAALALVLWLCGQLWLYGVWVLAYLTTFSLFLRIRSLAEHACLEQSPDMLRNTRTTRAGWLARLTVAPLSVNYHLEHHLMPGVPYYRLAAMHRLLVERGFTPRAPGYLDVLRAVSARPARG
ncbi:MAG: fatty acid desaturase family protein [Myxococcales bacterium]|nr:fatty acid desaturase family protein [Myxococcales bacterium]